jgi:stage II sporulation protein D
MDALKAQAVVARGEVLAKIGARHFLEPYRLCSSTHCQVYAGVKNENARTSRAVRATQGEFLFLGSELVDSVYSASCGGHTENNDTVWAQPPSLALRGKPDMESQQAAHWQDLNQHRLEFLQTTPPAFCNISSFNRPGLFRWTKVVSAKEMDALINKQKSIGRVMSLQVLDRGVSGRVKVVRVVGSNGDLVVQREWPIRQLLGNLKSGLFEVTVETDDEQMPKTFRFLGGGWGHGSGMCQIGAIGMAEHGYDYRQILGHYYNQAQVVKLYGGLPDSVPPTEDASTGKKSKGTPLVPEEE